MIEVLLLADDPNIWTAPLPVLVAIAGLGYLILRSRSDVLKNVAAATLPGPLGRKHAGTLVRIQGYSLLVVGMLGTALWFVDNL
ncbi:hypothetical protein OJ998_02215 [Solirubrobacter taibaiensis]|nr:hypothetical protein [Solirubrobacter taibaiensis]